MFVAVDWQALSPPPRIDRYRYRGGVLEIVFADSDEYYDVPVQRDAVRGVPRRPVQGALRERRPQAARRSPRLDTHAETALSTSPGRSRICAWVKRRTV